jgi:Kef-type K+ transport system membrane component KefB
MPAALLVIFGLMLVIAVARAGGALAVRGGQPRIAGELVGVMLVGPTVLGGQIEGVVQGAPGTGVVDALFPPLAVDVLTFAGTVGLILYMLLVGMTIDPAPLARRAGTIGLLALAIVATMGGLTLLVAPMLESAGGWKASGAASGAFALALGAGLAANGVPIVARILEERGLLRTDLGALVIAAAVAITTLALFASGVAVRGGDAGAAGHLALVVAIAAVALGIGVRLGRSPRMALPPLVAAGALLAIALGAGFGGKSLIGTALVGPLVVGVAVRTAGHTAQFFEARVGTLVRGALLPVFLGVAALHTNLRDLRPSVIGPALGLIAAVVVVKFAAGYGAARVAGLARSDAGAVGALLQCGGIMTIAISLDVLDAGVISTQLHATLTLAGIVTTVLAGPLLTRALTRGRQP